MIRSRAVVLQFPVPKRFPGPTTITAEHLPAWAVETGVLVGYHGKLSPGKIAQRLVFSQEGVHWEYAHLYVRPRPDERPTGDRSLNGLTLFDTKHAHVETARLLGQQWFQVAVQRLKERKEPFDRLNGVDFEDPEQYIPAFPECAGQIFRKYPNLDAIIGLVKSPVIDELAWVAMTPIWKVTELTEQAFMEGNGRTFMLRVQGDDGELRDIALPGKSLGPRSRRDEAEPDHSIDPEAIATCPT